MEIAQVSIQNFKALRDVTVPTSRFVCLIGENNVGKSSLLQALLFFVEPRKIQGDFFYNPEEQIAISVRLEEVSETDLSLISNQEHRGRIRAMLRGEALTLVRRFELDGTSRLRWVARVPTETRFGQTAIDELLKGQKAGSSFVARVLSVFPELKDQMDSKTSQTMVRELIGGLSSAIPDAEKVDQEMDLPTGFDNTIRPLLPEPIYIPAVKDLADDIKTKDSASFGKLLGILLNEITPELRQTEETFKVLNAWLNRTVDADGKVVDARLAAVREIESELERHVKENFRAVTLDIRIPPPEIKTVLASAQIWANDGVPGELNSKGDGLKRAVTFSILRTYVELKRKQARSSAPKPASSAGYLFLFEEPELYLYPTAQKILFDALGEISGSNFVFVSTHSPLFFGPEMAGTFVKLAKLTDPEVGPAPFTRALPISLRSVDEKSKFQLITYETSTTAFFCDTVVLVEGDSDFLVLPHLAKTINSEWDANRVGLAFCRISGKGGISRYRQFFKAFNIRVCVLGDLDCLLDGYQHLGAPEECLAPRRRLIESIDEYINTHNVKGKLSSNDLKEIADSLSRRERYGAIREIYERCLRQEATVEELRAAGDAFFGDEQNKKRRAVIEETSDPQVARAKDLAIEALRAHDIYLLRRGTIEAYYPNGLPGADKPSKALAFCNRIRTREEALALCDPVDNNGGAAPEFEVIFSSIFRPRSADA